MRACRPEGEDGLEGWPLHPSPAFTATASSLLQSMASFDQLCLQLVPSWGNGSCAPPRPTPTKAFHLLHQVGASQDLSLSLETPAIVGPWLTQRRRQRVQVRGLLVPGEQVAGHPREDKREA